MLKLIHPLVPATLFLCVIGFLSAANVRGEESSVVQSDPYAARKVFYEQQWQSKIEAALKFVDRVVVRVNVDLKPETGRTVTTKEYLPRPMIETEVQSEQKHHTQVASSEDSKMRPHNMPSLMMLSSQSRTSKTSSRKTKLKREPPDLSPIT